MNLAMLVHLVYQDMSSILSSQVNNSSSTSLFKNSPMHHVPSQVKKMNFHNIVNIVLVSMILSKERCQSKRMRNQTFGSKHMIPFVFGQKHTNIFIDGRGSYEMWIHFDKIEGPFCTYANYPIFETKQWLWAHGSHIALRHLVRRGRQDVH